jgi:quinol monooxygenase YgiN
MLVRIWRTRVDPTREEEYIRFTEEFSRPMFQQAPGCLTAVFLNRPPHFGALSYWTDDDALAAFLSSPIYLDTVRRLEETGLLTSQSKSEVFSVHGGFVGDLVLGPPSREP